MNDQDVFDVADEHAGERLDRWLATLHPGMSRSRFKELVKTGRVFRSGEAVTDPSLKVTPGEAYAVDLPPVIDPTPKPEAIPLNVLYEDEHVIVIDKPAGLVVHPAKGHWTGTLVNALLHHCAGGLAGIGGVARPGIVHRLDKDTSGVMVATKTDAAHRALRDMFSAHDLDRAYEALVWGAPTPLTGVVEASLRRGGPDRKRMVVSPAVHPSAKRAVTHYETLDRFGMTDDDRAAARASRIRCVLETGRTHQIRVHMADVAKTPVIGDPIYGQTGHARPLAFPRQALHAAELGFAHPIDGAPLFFRSEPPADMQALATRLRDTI